MSKIYDALEHARRQTQEPQKEADVATQRPVDQFPHPPVSPSTNFPIESSPILEAAPLPNTTDEDLALEGEMISLYQTIDSLLPGIRNKVILFMGSRSGEGTSTVTRNLAKVVALKLGKSVLIVDLDRSRPELKYYINLKLEHDLEEIIKGEVPIEKAFCQIGEDNLFISPLFQQSILDPQTLDSAKSRNFWEQLRQRFDLILIDSPPATLFSDGPYIARQADGVVLVVEAEKTSWPVVLSVKEQILKHGGNILGIVFNKRRYYIPKFIYKRL